MMHCQEAAAEEATVFPAGRERWGGWGNQNAARCPRASTFLLFSSGAS